MSDGSSIYKYNGATTGARDLVSREISRIQSLMIVRYHGEKGPSSEEMERLASLLEQLYQKWETLQRMSRALSTAPTITTGAAPALTVESG